MEQQYVAFQPSSKATTEPVRSSSTNSRPALRAAAYGGRPRPATTEAPGAGSPLLRGIPRRIRDDPIGPTNGPGPDAPLRLALTRPASESPNLLEDRMVDGFHSCRTRSTPVSIGRVNSPLVVSGLLARKARIRPSVASRPCSGMTS